MAARHGHVTLFPPGGDVIGRRRLDTHLDGLGQLGIRLRPGNNRTELWVIEGGPQDVRLRATRVSGKPPRQRALGSRARQPV